MAYLSDKSSRLNVGSALLSQMVSIFCGLIVPRTMIAAFGSEAYGATASIAQFLSYISLLEGGVSAVARAALYRPLAENDSLKISGIYAAIRHFFLFVGSVFLFGNLLLALGYHHIADISIFSPTESFLLVLIIGLSTMAQYFFGISPIILLHTHHRQYVGNLCSIAVTLLNTLMILSLTAAGQNLLTVKLLSSLIFLLRPLVFHLYVKRNYFLPPAEREDSALQQKWTGFGQHLAYFLHRNADIVLLTLLADVKLVAVYSVYALVSNSIRNIALAFSSGTEARFGKLLAEKDRKELLILYSNSQKLLSSVVVLFFGTAAVLILPFVKLYTQGFTDAPYLQPAFALVLLLAEALNCLLLPCSTLPIAANLFREIRFGAYGEVILNLLLSCLFMQWNPLLGVACGTLLSVIFRAVFYLSFTARHILKTNLKKLLFPILQSTFLLIISATAGCVFLWQKEINSFSRWILWAVPVFLSFAAIAALLYRFGGEKDEENPDCQQ